MSATTDAHSAPANGTPIEAVKTKAKGTKRPASQKKTTEGSKKPRTKKVKVESEKKPRVKKEQSKKKGSEKKAAAKGSEKKAQPKTKSSEKKTKQPKVKSEKKEKKPASTKKKSDKGVSGGEEKPKKPKSKKSSSTKNRPTTPGSRQIRLYNRRRNTTLVKLDDTEMIVDITTQGADGKWGRFSPFYAWENGVEIPPTVKFLLDANGQPIKTGKTVAGIWYSLMVFENEGADIKTLNKTNEKGIKRNPSKRTPPKPEPEVAAEAKTGEEDGDAEMTDAPKKTKKKKVRGILLGHQLTPGIYCNRARAIQKIYQPAYDYVIKHYLKAEFAELVTHLKNGGRIAILDYQTNEDLDRETGSTVSASAVLKSMLATEAGLDI